MNRALMHRKIRLSLVFVPVLVAGLLLLSRAWAQEIPYSTGTWDADSLGNHRAVLKVTQGSDAVRVRIPWRRRDFRPEEKNLIIADAATGAQIANIYRREVNREYCELAFQPQSVPGDYYVYYLPTAGSKKSNYPKIYYPLPSQNADSTWLGRQEKDWENIPRVEVREFQSIDSFNSFWPMEVIATRREVDSLASRFPNASYFVFPEDRSNPIKMERDIPLRWVRSGPAGEFRGTAARGEFYVFQLGVYALKGDLRDLALTFSQLRSEGSQVVIPSGAFRCINLGGVDWSGKDFTKSVSVGEGRVQALWCGVQIPENASPGTYRGSATVAAQEAERTRIPLVITVSPEKIPACGDDEPWRLSRLRWLDSRLACDDSLVPPYTPVKVRGRSLSILGRMVRLAASGLPESIQSSFAPEMTHLDNQAREILSAPVTLVAEDSAARPLDWHSEGVRFVRRAVGRAVWEARGAAGPLRMQLHAEMEFDGTIEYTICLRSSGRIALDDVRLVIPLKEGIARYIMGLGLKGGRCPDEYAWHWDVQKNQDGAWIGDVNAGLAFSLKDEQYSRPLNTNFYHSKPLVMPTSWCNGGSGGIRLKKDSVVCFSGPRVMKAGDVLYYNLRLVVTPFKPIDTKLQWSTRFYHSFKPVGEIRATGANTINVHHATAINPYLNYPFLRPLEMKAYADEAHAAGMKMKIYYTVRELSNHAPELFALRSLGDEILSHGTGGGFSWLQEHLGDDYIAAWFVPELKDAAVINSGVSRWHNYYVEGLQWLVRNAGIDGIYLDDVAFDRTTMKRVRKVLDRGRPGALIDLHSANQYNPRDGFANSANLYLEHFPFLDRLWFGEYFDYDAPPDFWLVEMSGIPFGLMGEMLEKGGNPWRGMLFGMTNRLPWAGDPRPVWKAWDEFGIGESKMVGYWAPSAPVVTHREDVLATCYQRPGKALISVASWAKERVLVRLDIRWKELGIDPSRALITAPAIEKFQEAAQFTPGDEIPVEPGKGWLLVISER